MILRLFSLFFSALLLLFVAPNLFAEPYYGGTLSYVAYGSEPPKLHGFQIMLNYDPQLFQWRTFNVYFDGGFSHFWQNSQPYHQSINVVSAAPVVRYLFRKRGPVHPYLELSVGLAYMDQTWMGKRNLGMHFSFQDRFGFGVLLGNQEQFVVGFHAVHYSNAKLCSHNSGFTAPVTLDVGYRFQ